MNHNAHRPKQAGAAAVLAVVSGIIAWAAYAAPSVAGSAFRPGAAEDVVAHVPARRTAAAKSIAALRQRNRTQPGDVAAALALAHAQIASSRVDGDPRPLGYAEQTLSPFLRAPEVDPEVLVLAATIAQSRHAFTDALHMLDRALAKAPDDAQALLTRASILTVIGRYEEALESCAQLAPRTSALVGHACVAPLRALRGDVVGADAELTAALRGVRSASERAWLESLLAELAYWNGRHTRAEAHAKTALSLDAGDRYTRALLADVLLDTQRPREVRALLEGRAADDALLLRDALAAQALASADAASLLATVHDRTAQNRARGDASHQREEARLLLASGAAPAVALATALANFRVQQEPWDVRILLEAAVAAKQPESAQPALRWLARTGFASPVLNALARALGEEP